jgi:7,8-dihydroneopterin aldolase/epimerase/oxygenase
MRASCARPSTPHPLARHRMDVIFIRDLRLDTRIGAYEFERRQPQTLQFEIEIGRPSIAACETDRLADTIDYAAVVKAIQGVLADHRFHLLEPLAEKLADVLLSSFAAAWIRLEVTKAGIVPGARYVGVRIERSR